MIKQLVLTTPDPNIRALARKLNEVVRHLNNLEQTELGYVIDMNEAIFPLTSYQKGGGTNENEKG